MLIGKCRGRMIFFRACRQVFYPILESTLEVLRTVASNFTVPAILAGDHELGKVR
jgi:hypothetical protein